MKTAKIILLIIASIFIIITFIYYVKMVKEIKGNKRVEKAYVEKKVKDLTILIMITIFLSFVSMFISIISSNNNVVLV